MHLRLRRFWIALVLVVLLVTSSLSSSSRPTSADPAATPQHASEVAIFFYPWYASADHDGHWAHWDQQASPPYDIGSNYYPAAGPYSSGDPGVMKQQMQEIAAAGIDTIIVSWWGQGSYEDSVLKAIIPAAGADGLKVAVHIEPYVGRDASSIKSDFAYLRALGIKDFYIYQADNLIEALHPLNDAYGDDRVFAEARDEGAVKDGSFIARLRDNGFQGIYTYDPMGYDTSDFAGICANAHAGHLLCMPSVGPGFNGTRATPIKRVLSRDNGATYDNEWQAAIDAKADIVTITSFNEWHEGTQIEPAVANCIPDSSYCYETYDGAWGLHGTEASSAYLVQTLHWSVIAKGRPPSLPAALLVFSSAIGQNDPTTLQNLKLIAPKHYMSTP